MEERQVLHVLVDELPDDDLVAAKRFLEYLRFRSHDPLRALLDVAPLDDEPVTDEDLAAIREGRAEKARGEVVSHE
jgi:predicted transcriptional regulator